MHMGLESTTMHSAIKTHSRLAPQSSNQLGPDLAFKAIAEYMLIRIAAI